MDGNYILIVDDNEENAMYLSEILRDNGYEYAVARDGNEALAAMQEKPPRLVLLDIFMPRKSGVLVFQSMKQDPRLEKIPVIVVTGASSVTGVDVKTGAQKPTQDAGDDFARGFGEVIREKLEGMAPDGLLEKPIMAPELVRKIGELVGT